MIQIWGRVRVEDEQRVIDESLELWAESGDVVPDVFERFFARSAEARELMQHSDAHMQGRMFEGVLELLMSESHLGSGGYLEWELDNHIDAYAATAPMYDAFFSALLESVQLSLGAAWTPRIAAAWDQRIGRIMAQVHAHPER